MLKCSGVALTDQVNRYNERVIPKAILECYSRTWEDKKPVTMNHDRTKPIGWSYLGGIFIEPGIMYQTIKSEVVETQIERNELLKEYQEHVERVYLAENEQSIDMLCEKLGSHIVGNYELGLTNATAIINKGIVLRVFPELEEMLLKKGLFDLNLFELVMPGIYKRGDFLLFASPYLRRNLSRLNTFSEPLLKKLEKLRETDINVEIALDMDMIGLLGTEHKYAEYEYWWGPSFSDDLDSIPEGITRHKNNEENIAFSNVDFTEFGWYTHDNKKVFESEEVVANPNINVGMEDEKYGCRYVHSILNPDTKLPYHLDGAIRAYNLEEFAQRIEIPLNKAGRNTEYTKLWRIDNDISVNLWKELVNDFYRDNMLIGEYLGGVDIKVEEIKKEKESEIEPLDKFIPIDMKENDGISLYFEIISELEKSPEEDVCIFSPYISNFEDGVINWIDANTVTLVKEIKKFDLKIDDNQYVEIAYEDLISNFPIFICDNKESAKSVQKALLNLISIWISHEDDRLVSYTIEYPLKENKWIKVSVAGHINDILKTFNHIENNLPDDNEINQWILDLYEYISKKFSRHKTIQLSKFLSEFGNLHFVRIPVDVKKVMNKDELNVISENNLSFSKSYIVLKTECLDCHNDYRKCNCNKYIGKGEEIKEAILLNAYWTNRSCFINESKE